MKLRWRWPIYFKEEQKRATLGNPNDSIWDAILNETETAGVYVNTNTSLTLSAVYSSINILSNSLNLPINVYKKDKNGDRDRVRTGYEKKIEDLLRVSPNQIMTPTQWIQLMETSRNLYGNAFSIIRRINTGEIGALEWVHPSSVHMMVDGNAVTYEIIDALGVKKENVHITDMIHVKAASFDGFLGKSPIELARESLGFGIATQKSGNKFHENGMKASGILIHPGTLTKKGKDNLSTSFDAQYAGTKNSGKTMVLEEGVKYQQLTISPQDAQFLESRKFSITEVARWFNIPEHMLANNDPTYTNIEQQALSFITYNVRPRVRLYEQEFNWKLLGNDKKYFVEFDLRGLMRADATTRASYYVQMLQNGIMNRNEIRQLENLNKIDKGDEFMTPLNLAFDSERNKEGINDE